MKFRRKLGTKFESLELQSTFVDRLQQQEDTDLDYISDAIKAVTVSWPKYKEHSSNWVFEDKKRLLAKDQDAPRFVLKEWWIAVHVKK